jgi:hypothetical protein
MTFFKKILLQRMFALASAFLVLLSACSDDDSAPKDVDLPSATVTGLQANAVVWNTFTITVAAEDNDAVQKIEVKLDNALVLTQTEASFSYELKTTDLEDGPHTVTIIVTDVAGNQKTQEYTFTVRNTLITLDVPTDFLKEGEKGFIFLSDATGKSIVSQAYENGDQIRLKAPAYNSDEFYLTEVILGDPDRIVRTFSNVNRGTWVLTPIRDASFDRRHSATAQLSFANALPGMEYYLVIGSGYTYLNDGQTNTSLDLYTNPSPVYRSRTEDNKSTHYLLTAPVSGGSDNDEIDLSLVSNPLTHETTDVSNYGYVTGGGSIYGLLTPGDYSTRYNVGSCFINDGNLSYSYPENAFPAYYSYVNLWGDDFDIVNSVPGMPDYTPLPAEINMTVGDGTIKGTITSEDADLVFTWIRFKDGYSQWLVYSAKGTIDLVIPEIPNDLQTNLTLEDVSFISASAVQKFNFEGYDGYLNAIRNSSNGAHTLKSLGEKYKLIENFLTIPEGRKPQSLEEAATSTYAGRKHDK